MAQRSSRILPCLTQSMTGYHDPRQKGPGITEKERKKKSYGGLRANRKAQRFGLESREMHETGEILLPSTHDTQRYKCRFAFPHRLADSGTKDIFTHQRRAFVSGEFLMDDTYIPPMAMFWIGRLLGI